MEKSIYELQLHEMTSVKVQHVDWEVTRVPGGWIYRDNTITRATLGGFFVPYNDEFETAPTDDENFELPF